MSIGLQLWRWRDCREYDFILPFDLADDLFGQIKLPERCYNVRILDNFVMVLRERLSLVIKYRNRMDVCVDIWVMVDSYCVMMRESCFHMTKCPAS